MAMRIFETLHLLLLAVLVIGVPPGQEFWPAQGFRQGAICGGPFFWFC
jgi:hypothetical protein